MLSEKFMKFLNRFCQMKTVVCKWNCIFPDEIVLTSKFWTGLDITKRIVESIGHLFQQRAKEQVRATESC